MISYKYKCPICGRRTATAVDMCKHMERVFLRFEEHWGWIESHGVNFPEMLGVKNGKLGQGSYKALAEAVEEECKI